MVKKLTLLLFFITLTGSALFAGGSNEVDVDVNLPIAEIEGLIAKLEETGSNLIGDARVEMSKLIDDIDSKIGDRLDQIKNMGHDLWKMMYGDLKKELDGMKTFLMDYTKMVNDMVAARITQIDQVFEARINQLDSVLERRLDQVDGIIQRTIKSIEKSFINIIEQGERSIITIMDDVAVNIVRVVVIILLVILFFLIALMAWKGIYPKKIPSIVVTAVVIVLFIGSSVTVLASNRLMAHFFYKEINVNKSVLAAADINPPVPGEAPTASPTAVPTKPPLVVGVASPAPTKPTFVLKLINAPDGTQPSGLAWDGNYLWMSSYMKNGGIYAINIKTGSVIKKYTPKVANNNGYGSLVYQGGSILWHADAYGSGIYQLNTRTMQVVKTIPSPDKYPRGLAWDGKYLWSFGYPSRALYMINPANGAKTKVNLSINLDNVQNMGIVYVGGYYYISIENIIYKFKLQADKVNAPVKSLRMRYSRVESLTFDGKYIWAASFDQGKIFRVNLF